MEDIIITGADMKELIDIHLNGQLYLYFYTFKRNI